jgi:hypothetical protein
MQNKKKMNGNKINRFNSTWFWSDIDPILRNDFSCRSGSTEKPIVAVTDLFVFIRMLFFLTAYFGCVTKKIVRTQKQTNNLFKNETREREKEWGEQNFSELVIACQHTDKTNNGQ